MENLLSNIANYFKNFKKTNNRKHFLLSVVILIISLLPISSNSQIYNFFNLDSRGSFIFNNGKFNNYTIETRNTPVQDLNNNIGYLDYHTSSISDENGNLLLYISENKIRNSKHKVIENGEIVFYRYAFVNNSNDSIDHGISSIRHLFVKRPGNSNQYILFYIENNLLLYSLINYNKLLGEFKVVEKNLRFDNNITYAFDLTFKKGSSDIWIIRKLDLGNYSSHLISENSLNSYTKIFNLGIDTLTSFIKKLDANHLYPKDCVLKIAPKGDHLLFGFTNKSNTPFHILKFDNLLGVIENKILMPLFLSDELQFNIISDFEFSTKSKNIVIIHHQYISLINYSIYDSTNILNSFISFSPNLGQFGKLINLFIAPDKNIYLLANKQASIKINNNLYIKDTAISLYRINYLRNKNNNNPLTYISEIFLDTSEKITFSILDFPFEVMTSQLYEVDTELTKNLCVGEDFMLDCNVLKPLEDTLYKWTGPKNFTSNLKNPIIPNIDKSHEGIYTVEITNSKKDKYYTGFITLQVHEAPKFSIKANKLKFCEYDSVRLSVVEEIPTSYKLLWSNGDTTLTTFGKESGEYSLTITNEYGCSSTQKITIEKVPAPQFNLTKDGEECGTVEITLKSDVEFPTTFKYLWNTGAITPELKVSKNGVYTLIVTDTNGCETSKSIEIIFGKKPIAEIKAMGATTFCEGGRVELRATGGMNSSDLNFEWNTGEKVPNIWVDKSDIYKVIITHKFSNCVDSAEIEIKVNPNLVSKIEQIGSLCKGEEVELQATPQGTEYKYLWSNGATTSSIKVSQAGNYTVEVSLDGTCKSSAEIEVIENQAEDFEIIAEGKFCIGEVVKLTSSRDFAEYLWSNGETTKEISVTLSGTYKLMVTDENGCTNEKSIIVEFISPREYKLDFNDYDFGNVEIGSEKRVKVNIPDEIGFKLRGDFALDINTMEMVFKPDTERDYSGEIVLNGGNCDTSVTIKFRGRGVNSVKYLGKVIAPKVTTEAGLDNVELPIKFEINDENLVYPFELDYKLTLSLNYDVYIPQIPSTINGTKREIEVAGKVNITKGENILTTIKGKTYLSQGFENEIKILIFEHNTNKLSVEQEDGYLNITGICVPDLRGLNFFTPTTMMVSPNPVSSDLTIKINTVEKGNHKLRLIDITGNSREIANYEVKELTEKVIKINSKELSKGQYFLELITPNQTITEKVVVE